jgi:hypothetical protein
LDGGSGGGAASENIVDGTPGASTKTIGLGFAGGNSAHVGGNGAGGGGGGAGSVGADAVSEFVGGIGGDGVQSDITGSSLFYAAGGCGGNMNNTTGNTVAASGIGGITNQSDVVPTPPTANTGSGGAGGTFFGTGTADSGYGADGVVIVRIINKTHTMSWSGGLTGHVSSGADGTTVGNDWYYKFTAGTGTVTFTPVDRNIIYSKSYTVSTLPSAESVGGIIYVSDEVGGATLAFSDGTNWRRVTDRAVVA